MRSDLQAYLPCHAWQFLLHPSTEGRRPPFFLTISLSGLVDLCHLRLCIQDLLQLVMVGRAVLVHQPEKGLLCRFILKKQTTFIPEWNEEKYERVEVVLSLILLLRIKQLVVWKTWLFELGILSFPVIVSTLPRVSRRDRRLPDSPISWDSVCPIDSLHKYPCCLDHAGPAVPTLGGPSADGSFSVAWTHLST